MSAAGGHRTDSRSQLPEGSSRLSRERLAKNFAMFGFGRPAMFGRAQFESRDEFLVEVADDQLGHKWYDSDDIAAIYARDGGLSTNDCRVWPSCHQNRGVFCAGRLTVPRPTDRVASQWRDDDPSRFDVIFGLRIWASRDSQSFPQAASVKRLIEGYKYMINLEFAARSRPATQFFPPFPVRQGNSPSASRQSAMP